MAHNNFDSREASYDPGEPWNNFSPCHTEDGLSAWQAPTPGFLSSAASNISSTDQIQSQVESPPQSFTPPLLQSDNFGIPYAVEWKVMVNKRQALHETEQGSEMRPRKYWESFLKPKIDEALVNKFPDRVLKIEDTNIIVSVDERGYKNKKLIKRFDKLKIEWYVIETQLSKWAESLSGRELLVHITINYNGSNNQVSANHRGRVNKRGASSATRRMLAERDAQICAEEDSLGAPSPWKDVYNLMRCPGPPCRLGPHCWRDPKDKLHHKLTPNRLKDMVQYVEQGGKILSHEDVPDFIRKDILEAEEQRQNHPKPSHHRAASHPPINITNILPTHSSSVTHQMASDSASNSAPPTRSSSTDRLNVHGFLDQAVTDYTEYKISQAVSDTWKDGFHRCGVIALQKGLDLDLLYREGHKVFDGHDIIEGLAKQYARDIKFWIEEFHQGGEEI
jgi:hypothetical protein